MQRVTKRDMLMGLCGFLVDNNADDAFIEFVNTELEKLNRPVKPTAAQIENEGIKGQILGILQAADNGLTATQIATRLNLTVQKTTALLAQLVKANKITRIEAIGKVKTKFII